jgi:hypothetical protein
MAMAVTSAALLIGWRFDRDVRQARDHAAQGSAVLQTPCGLIEYQAAGAGQP